MSNYSVSSNIFPQCTFNPGPKKYPTTKLKPSSPFLQKCLKVTFVLEQEMGIVVLGGENNVTTVIYLDSTTQVLLTKALMKMRH